MVSGSDSAQSQPRVLAASVSEMSNIRHRLVRLRGLMVGLEPLRASCFGGVKTGVCGDKHEHVTQSHELGGGLKWCWEVAEALT